jgi:murein DD-endopeptidase MepM/ murein hydrolase activator NlpD
MKYTIRFAHMADIPNVKVGDTVTPGMLIGVMGTSGQSTAPHLHTDCIEGAVSGPYKLADIGTKYRPAKEQLDFFIDNGLFGVFPVITTGFMDKEYRRVYGKDHPAYDVVPIDRFKTKEHFGIHWNPSFNGVASLIVYQPESYGHCLYVTFGA